MWFNHCAARGRCVTINEWTTQPPQYNLQTEDLISPKKEREYSDLQSEDEVEIFLCRSCQCRHPPQICSCSCWWREHERQGTKGFNHPSSVRYQYRMIKILPQILPLSVNVWQMLWRSSDVFPMKMTEVKLLWLHIPACTSATTKTQIKQQNEVSQSKTSTHQAGQINLQRRRGSSGSGWTLHLTLKFHYTIV